MTDDPHATTIFAADPLHMVCRLWVFQKYAWVLGEALVKHAEYETDGVALAVAMRQRKCPSPCPSMPLVRYVPRVR